MATCTVTIRDRDGRPFTTTTAGASLFEVVRDAVEFFRHPFWKGPRPANETTLEVSVIGSGRSYRVRVGRVTGW